MIGKAKISDAKSAVDAPKSGKLTPAEQRRRFEETARELGCDEGQALDAAFGKIVPPKVPVMKPGRADKRTT